MVPDPQLEKCIVIGELGLNGSVRGVRGVIGKILSAKSHGFTQFIIPADNMKQASLIPGIEVVGWKSLEQAYKALQDQLNFVKTKPSTYTTKEDALGFKEDVPQIEDIVGQERAKRALVIAAAGHHNILLNGPPGTGKSMLAKALVTIMPPLTSDERLEVTQLHSLADRNYEKIVAQRPIRAPHHSSSQVSIVGGGQNPKPGEISLSHNGILFFDEFPEFSRSVVEAFRQPLEDGKISVSRAKGSLEFPADFILVATANPCPCGYYNSSRECTCMPHQIQQYQKRVSGPVIDRIDLYVDVDEVAHADLLSTPKASHEKSQDILRGVEAARQTQIKRSRKLNSRLANKELKKYAKLDEDTEKMLNSAADKLGLSARDYMRTLRVSRTIADLNGHEQIKAEDVSEALQYRKRPLVL